MIFFINICLIYLLVVENWFLAVFLASIIEIFLLVKLFSIFKC